MQWLQRPIGNAGSVSTMDIGLSAPAGEMQHSINLPPRENRDHFGRKGLRFCHAIHHGGDHLGTRGSKLKIPGAIFACEIKNWWVGRAKPRAEKFRKIILVPVRTLDVGKPGSVGRFGRMRSDRKHREESELLALRVRLNGPRGITARQCDSGVILVRPARRDDLHPQQRGKQHAVSAQSQSTCCALAVGIGPGDKKPHGSGVIKEVAARLRLELASGFRPKENGIMRTTSAFRAQ